MLKSVVASLHLDRERGSRHGGDRRVEQHGLGVALAGVRVAPPEQDLVAVGELVVTGGVVDELAVDVDRPRRATGHERVRFTQDAGDAERRPVPISRDRGLQRRRRERARAVRAAGLGDRCRCVDQRGRLGDRLPFDLDGHLRRHRRAHGCRERQASYQEAEDLLLHVGTNPCHEGVESLMVGGRSPGFRASPHPRLPGIFVPVAASRWRDTCGEALARSQWRVRVGLAPTSLGHRP